MSSELAISVRGVGKAFPSFEHPWQQMLHMVWPRSRPASEFHALSGVSLDVRRGEAVGIIGRNGSGKSTLLQLISGILTPSAGTVQVHGRIAALLELGAGFNPEFTGRENILLNASLLGLSQAEVQARMGDILAFAEIGDYVDQQVKTYSSGMFVRLAFAVAVYTDPDILIVDESLAVGDIYFQRKCHKRIEELRQRGCTLLFVTHAADLLLQLCDRKQWVYHSYVMNRQYALPDTLDPDSWQYRLRQALLSPRLALLYHPGFWLLVTLLGGGLGLARLQDRHPSLLLFMGLSSAGLAVSLYFTSPIESFRYLHWTVLLGWTMLFLAAEASAARTRDNPARTPVVPDGSKVSTPPRPDLVDARVAWPPQP